MLDFSLDQHGSRFIQQHLGELTQAELSIAFHELLPKALTLMNDVFGNYVIQKVLELGPAGHRSELMLQMRGQVGAGVVGVCGGEGEGGGAASVHRGLPPGGSKEGCLQLDACSRCWHGCVRPCPLPCS
jgi:hypothetical protein